MINTSLQLEIKQAIELLSNDEIVAIPTETVYGLAANAESDAAIKKIYKIKDRPSHNPLICHFHNIKQMQEYVEISPLAEFLLTHLSPGPITLVLPIKNDKISKYVTCGLKTLAVRIPNHPIMEEILKNLKFPLAAPSANSSGMISPTSSQHVIEDLGSKIPLIISYNQKNKIGLESTICIIKNNVIKILRPGFITKTEIEDKLKNSQYKNIIVEEYEANIVQDKDIISPGQLLKHYATKKPLRINTDSNFDKDEFVIAFGKNFPDANINLSLDGKLSEAATNLFDYLHIADNDHKSSKIAITPIPNIGIGIAINNRILRASQK